MNKNTFALTPFELSMYLAQLADPASTEYSVDCYFDISGSTKEAVHSAVSDMIQSHEILRSRYETENGMPVRVLTDDHPRIQWMTAPSPDAVQAQALREKVPFDLKEVPVRFTGYELPKGRILVRMEIHHIAFDGRSVMIWQRELFERLRGNTPARQSDLSTRSDDAYDLEPGRKYYRELFADGVPAHEMPLKAPRGRIHPGADRQISIPFPEERLARLNAVAKACGVTTFTFLLAGISIALGVYCGSEDVTLGFPVDMRGAEEKNMAGMFINTAIVRLKPERAKPLPEYLKEVSRAVHDAAHDKWLPMSEVIRSLRVAPDKSRNPVFDVGVNYLFTPELCRDGELSVAFSYELQTLRRDMNITMHRHDGYMDMLVRYASKLFDEALIRRFLEQLSTTLSRMSDLPNAAIAQVCLLPGAQAEMIRRFSENARRCIVDRRGFCVPVGVAGWLTGSGGLLGAPARWDEQGGVVLMNDDPDRAQASIVQQTLPPPMPEGDPDLPVRRVQIEPKMDPAELAAFCGANDISLHALLSTAFGYTLAAYSNAEEALFGLLFSVKGEDGPGLLKAAPVILPMESGKNIRELLRDVQGQLGAFVESDGLLCEACREGDPRRGAMIACLKEGQADDLDAVLTSGRAGLLVKARLSGGTLSFQGACRADTFCDSFIGEFLKCFIRVLSEMTRREKPDEISLMDQDAFAPYDRVNRTSVPVEIVSVDRLFERQVRLHPDKTAVIVAGETMTFDQLNRLANRAARGLRALGVGRDSIVGMVLDRTKEIFIAEHAILKAGGAFLPMVPEYPDERIRYCLQDAQSSCVITTEAIRASRPALFSEDGACRVLTVEALIQNDGEENLDLPIEPDSLAYCIYTSGSTGKPKGVMIEHRNMCNYLNANPRHPAIYWHTQDIRAALSVTSISFDMSITERFVSLCNGVTLCMATLDEIHDPLALARLMNANHVESIVCTPSYLMSLLEIPEMRVPIAALKAYHVGGEAFPSTLIGRLKELNRDSRVINGYGPTETSVCCTSSEILPGQPITIGRPDANVEHYVMDRHLRPLPQGACGELIICGAGVGRGYVKLPEKTAASFFTFRGRPAYHSGDLVRLYANGEYDFYGRLDNQVKLRGLRVELDEIETVINEYPGIRLSKVIVRNNGTEDYLAAYYTAEHEIPVDDLRRFLKKRLTPYMVPDAMMQLDEMPLTVNGKIDKKRLPDLRDAMEKREYVAPVGALEEQICAYFARALNLERVGATDSFFEIGGTSLSVAIVVSACMNAGLDVVYKNVFDHPTPRALAAFVDEKQRARDARKPRAAEADAGRDSIPSSKYHDILSKNSVKALSGLKTGPLGAVLLTGATGFLGIHVLRELLQREDVPRIVCLVRSRKRIDPLRRLSLLLEYYFSDTFDETVQNKVRIADSDITDEDLAGLLKGETIDTIINCAAVVKHFETGDLIHRVNYEGVRHLIDLALRKKARLVQISTLSIAGFIEADKVDSVILRETDYDLGQKAVIKYIASKFEAEGAILDAMENRGLKGKIIRIGNLMGRRSDGEFQINFRSNGFINRLRAYNLIGCFPVSMMDTPVEFSPVDLTARAVVLLAGTPDGYSVFHANNCHDIHFANVLEAFEYCGFHIDVVDDEVFRDRFHEALSDAKKGVAVSSLVAYNTNLDETLQWVKWDNSYTVKALYRLGFSWPLISPQYLHNNLRFLSEMGFFDLDSRG